MQRNVSRSIEVEVTDKLKRADRACDIGGPVVFRATGLMNDDLGR